MTRGRAPAPRLPPSSATLRIGALPGTSTHQDARVLPSLFAAKADHRCGDSAHSQWRPCLPGWACETHLAWIVPAPLGCEAICVLAGMNRLSVAAFTHVNTMISS